MVADVNCQNKNHGIFELQKSLQVIYSIYNLKITPPKLNQMNMPHISMNLFLKLQIGHIYIL